VFSAENLLGGTPILEQVLQLRDDLSRDSDGTIVSYDDMFLRIQQEVDALPVLELQMNVMAGSEGAYQRQLLIALEKINDDHDRVLRKVLKLKSRLLNAQGLMANKRTQFAAFYTLAINIAIHTIAIPKFKISAAHSKEMAASEFSKLMDRLDNLAPSFISELELLEVEIKQRKKTQADKYALGKDQVNAMWNSIQSNGAIGLDDTPDSLIKRFPVEEDLEEIPSYVSKHSKEVRVAANASLVYPLDTFCSRCGEKQISTPSGDSCPNGHGGVPPLEEGEVPLEAAIKGTFTKVGDPKPITPIVDEGGGEALLTEEERLHLLVQLNEAKTNPDYDLPCNHQSPSAAIYEAAEGLHKEGMIDDTTMEEFRQECVPELTFEEAMDVVNFKPVVGEQPLVVTGDIVEDIESIVNQPASLATQAPSTPRKKLILDDEDLT
jgi:hypothetical protein